MKNVMIDNETLAVTADAVIMSIGAVEFDLDGSLGDKFYRSISIDSNLALGRCINESTLLWWLQQSPEAQQVFHEAKVELTSALQDLASWFPANLDAHGNNTTLVWSNGASFDIPMLEHAYKQCGMESPWEFYNSRCVRTYRDLPGAKNIQRPAAKITHNALDDAIAQALYVQAIHAEVFGVKEIA